MGGYIQTGTWEGGQFKEDTLTTPDGTIKTGKRLPNQRSYFYGMVVNGKPDGFGELVRDNGNVYSGTWEAGKLEQGKMTDKCGRIYTGKLTDIHGSIYYGDCSNELPNGFGEMVRYDNAIFTGCWIDGSFTGSYISHSGA